MAYNTLDLKTPRNVHFSAFYKRSFAYHTVKNRMPVILTQIIDGLVRNKEQIKEDYGDEAIEEYKIVIGDLSKLKYEIQTNKVLRPLTSTGSDVPFYNHHLAMLANQAGNVTYFGTIWLTAECYMYRRIRESFELTTYLQDFDVFANQKQESFTTSMTLMSKLGDLLLHSLELSKLPEKNIFVTLVKSDLWGNKCDLSISNGVMGSTDAQNFNIKLLNPFIVCDHSDQLWKAVCEPSASTTIDIIFDNAGYELFSDLCLADYLISTGLAKSIRFHVKAMPWFISDVMSADFSWALEQLGAADDLPLRKLGAKWADHVAKGRWTVHEHDFWTLPVDYSEMATQGPKLYAMLAEAKIAIFKGDLNYRKVFGEKNWDPSTPVDDAMQGFHPTRVCCLRTIKCDMICGLARGLAEEIEKRDSKWMETGHYGLIQFSDLVI